jgi:transcriptional regulator with XRE-family HTH domain
VRKNQHSSKAKIPFAAQIAREFGVSKSYAWRILNGERQGPKASAIRARQAQLLKRSAERKAVAENLSEIQKHED